MTKRPARRALPMLAMVASFGAGVFVDGWLRTNGPPKPVQLAYAQVRPTVPRAGEGKPDTPAMATVTGPSGALSHSRLRVPLDNVGIEALKGGFSELRGSRPHEAADIVAPRGTPIHAVQDGTIAKLFFSQQGGTTIYEFDQEGRLCYYYAHLERYANGLHDGQRVSQGEVIGYVGTSGNAPPETPHLHFAIFERNADRKWWQGRPLDPYLVFKDQG